MSTVAQQCFGLQRLGTAPVDLIVSGLLLEVQEHLLPTHAWPVRVIENIGGRLLLRYEGASSAAHDFWLFYQHLRLHELGWARQQQHVSYQLPQGVLLADV